MAPMEPATAKLTSCDLLPSHTGLTRARSRVASGVTSTAAGMLNPAAMRWFTLAVASLLLSGLFAVFLVVGRIPIISEWIADPAFFRRCLVLHVNLSLLVWFTAFTAALYSLLPTAVRPRLQAGGFALAALGTIAMALATFIRGTEPVLSNYIPFIDHPVFTSGVALFLSGVAMLYAGSGISRSRTVSTRSVLPPESAIAIQAAAAAFLVACVTFVISWWTTPRGIAAASYYELIAWGGGHVLQIANVSAMAALWFLLLRAIDNRPVLGPRITFALFLVLLFPYLSGPILAASGTDNMQYYRGFTRLMQFGIFPVITVFLCAGVAHLVRARRDGILDRFTLRDFRLAGFTASVIMTVCGFALGAMIRGSTTLVPAHYHASIGAVTVAFMAAAYLLLGPRPQWNASALRRRLPSVQIMLFGGGQLLFALGFAISGFLGLGRKIYAGDQVVHAFGEYAGLLAMGLGGGIAVTGGILFLWLIVSAILAGAPPLRNQTSFSQQFRSSDPNH